MSNFEQITATGTGSETLLRIRSLASYIIGTLESRFRKRQAQNGERSINSRTAASGSLLTNNRSSISSLELELVALRHQVTVLRRHFSTDRLLWVWLYRVWPQVLNAMCWSNQQPWSSGIAKASGSPGGGDHAVWDGPDDPRSVI
jgi:hypothetical protein